MEAEPQTDKQKKQATESAADLEKVTDYAEEKEIDVANVGSILAGLKQSNSAASVEKEKQLASIKISKDDVEIIMTQMEVNKQKAERTLREHNGNVVEALITLVNC